MKPHHILKALFPVLMTLAVVVQVFGQEKFNIAAGLGHPELIHVGLRYQMGQSQLGISAGFFPGEYEDAYSVGADYYYHFGTPSVLSSRLPWYGRIGVYQFSLENEYEKNKYLLLVPRIGKDFNISPKLGIAADVGISLVLSREQEGIYGTVEGRSDVLLSLGFNIFYRL